MIMKNNSFILSLFLLFLIATAGWAESPCGTSTGNSFVRLGWGPGTTRIGGKIQAAVDNNCGLILPDFRGFLRASVSRLYWRVDSVKQFPAPGTSFLLLASSGCPEATEYIKYTAYFRNTRGTANPRDDQFCEMRLQDTMYLVDKTSPTARAISITSTDLRFEPGRLKHHFGSSVIGDNCTSLINLQNSLEFASEPYSRPLDVPIYCEEVRNTYRVRYRVKDNCGNHSDWALATIRFKDTTAPRVLTLASPSSYFLDSSCSFTIRRSLLTVYGADDWITGDRLRYSYRIIHPASLAGNIPVAGRRINALGMCPPDNRISIRVCAQDCEGNGDLHLSDNGMSANCNSVFVSLEDTIRPRISGPLGPIALTISDVNSCTVAMPNLAHLLSGYDECSDVSIYQQPAPGSILNNGEPKGMALARGIPRLFDCGTDKINDVHINCTGNGPLKSYTVSFFIVDCHGNCSIKTYPSALTLFSPISGLVVSNEKSASRVGTLSSIHSEGLSMDNYPNPFGEITTIQIHTTEPMAGMLQFYNIQGQKINQKPLYLQKGMNTTNIIKSELGTGMIWYRYEGHTPTNQRVVLNNKMMILN